MDAPRRGLDPAALAVFAVAVVLLVGVSAYVGWRMWRDPPLLVAKPKAAPPPVAKPKAAPPPVPARELRKVPAEVPVPSKLIVDLGAGRTWRYRVTVEPPLWRDATLAYRIIDRGGEKLVDTDFQYAGGKMNFRLGALAAGHPSHASTRFPGFFMYVAYLHEPLDEGRAVSWEWPWQLPGGQTRPGRVKRFVGEVKAWENLSMPPSANAPANILNTARIEGMLSYIEDGVQRASASETLWYAPRFLQVVKIVREGRSPDEGATRIVAELIEHTYP
ncbi:MAG TPA: hypothetical protein VM140_10890 [Burkholderiales bacterium]|nr:hypothetical protein [Burkholderiales bacterium]